MEYRNLRANEQIGRRLKVRDIHTLRVVVDAGSMAKAASELALSQSAVSKIVSELEELLGVSLLERSSRGVRLTPAGQVLVDRGRVVFDELTQTIDAVVRFADPAQGEVRIGTTEPMTSVLSDIIEKLSLRHPRITFFVSVSDTDTIIRELRDRTLDVVLTRWISPLTATEDLHAEMLFETPLAIVAAKKHPLMRRKRMELADIMHERWTLSPKESFLGRIVNNVFQSRGLELPAAAVTSVSIYMRLNLIATARYLSVLPLTMVRHATIASWLGALPIDLRDSSGPIAAITLKRRHQSGAVQAFCAAARSLGARA
jgi:DNA-binding transcriptional LysR family regulator